jgi:glycosyltransferase involved in cell wall biosynthesis
MSSCETCRRPRSLRGDSPADAGQKAPMRRGVLFVHNNFPAQFMGLAQALLARDVPCAAIGGSAAPGVEGVRIARYRLPRGTGKDVFPLAIRAEADLIRARTAYDGAKALRADGFEPEIIVAHPGWGETALLRELYPDTPQVLFAEFFYKGRNSDIDFDSEFFPSTEDALLTGKAKSAVAALAFSEADAIVAPTPFQASLLPRALSRDVHIIHEGVDLDAIRPGPATTFALDDGRMIAPGAPVITHINNQMEPLRGLHIFARALPALLEAVPNAQVIVIGTAGTRGYGGSAPEGRTWKEVCFDGLTDRLDQSRLHFLGKVPHPRMLAALRLSTAHVYYSYPFVLSWSLSEAMASACYVIGSDTAPLRDAIEDGVNGRLLPFFDVDALSQALIAACRDPAASTAMRAAARRTAEDKFSQAKGIAAWFALLRDQGLQIPA